MRDPHESVSVDLSDEQWFLLRCGLVEWGGPARCTPAMAVALGFASVENFFDERYRLIRLIETRQALIRWDWTRSLLATEVVFASNVLGSGREWPITTGLDDVQTIRTLRELQAKLASVVCPMDPDARPR
jgi:hypothetical protein